MLKVWLKVWWRVCTAPGSEVRVVRARHRVVVWWWGVVKWGFLRRPAPLLGVVGCDVGTLGMLGMEFVKMLLVNENYPKINTTEMLYTFNCR